MEASFSISEVFTARSFLKILRSTGFLLPLAYFLWLSVAESVLTLNSMFATENFALGAKKMGLKATIIVVAITYLLTLLFAGSTTCC